jgi:hypothetical protein
MKIFADLGPYDEPRTLDEDEWSALVRLEGECPDHADRFSVGDNVATYTWPP